MTEIRPFTTINHKAQKELGLSITDYCLADTIHNLASNPANKVSGWCWASRKTLAVMLDVSERTVYKGIKKMSAAGLLEMDHNANIRATAKWYKATNTAKIAGGTEKSAVTPLHNVQTTYRENNKSKQGTLKRVQKQDLMWPK